MTGRWRSAGERRATEHGGEEQSGVRAAWRGGRRRGARLGSGGAAQRGMRHASGGEVHGRNMSAEGRDGACTLAERWGGVGAPHAGQHRGGRRRR